VSGVRCQELDPRACLGVSGGESAAIDSCRQQSIAVERPWRLRCCLRVARLLILLAPLCATAQDPAASLIPASELTALEQELEQGAHGKSTVEVRMACKSVARQASALLEASPEAPNRYAVLAVLFQCQKRLLRLDATERNRNALFETVGKLSEAPDDYAELRLEADLLLSERELATANATVTERVQALEKIIEKYRDTSAERRCLRMTLMIASKLRAYDLEMAIEKRLAEGRFVGDHEMIASRPLANIDAVFSGTYESSDKALVRFPSDRLGHQYLVMFWSTKSKGSVGHEAFLAGMREQQERFSGRFEVYSFNLDEMPDAGKSILSQSGVKGMALHLPGGRRHSAYRAYARRDPLAILVNAQGHAELSAGQYESWSGNSGAGLEKWLDDARYVAQLRSLFVGDFLVVDQRLATSDQRLASDVQAIQKCFVAPPFRYRLTRKEELANYRKAEELCTAAIKKYAKASDLWAVRNCRIVALIGMWNLTLEPKYLEEAVKEAKTVLGMSSGQPTPNPSKEGNSQPKIPSREGQGWVLPPGADVVARFCLVKDALWREGAIPEVLLRDFVDAAGAGQAPARALAAAAVLAIEANAERLYQDYRQRLLCLSDEDHPGLWPVLSLIRDRHHNHRLFWGNPGRWGYGNVQKYRCRYVVSGLGAPNPASRVLVATFKDLEGGALEIPDVTKEKMTGIIFVEPPVDTSDRDVCVKRLKDFAGQFSRQGVPVIVAFLSEDTNTVESIIKECGGSFRAGIVPDGLGNPLVRRLGILSADRMPNPFLLHGDGSIAWWISGLSYTVARTPMEHAVSASIGINIEKLRTDRTFQPLEQGDFKRAVLLLTERLPPKKGGDWWTADRFQGRALAHMGLKDWKAALTDIDAAMSARAAASRLKRQMSMGDVEMHLAKSTVLKKLGRDEDAAKERTIGEDLLAWLANNPDGGFGFGEKPPSYARGGVPVGVYDDLLKRIRLALPGEVK
jgi:hypothetical protein